MLQSLKKFLQFNPYADAVPLYEAIVKWSRQKVFFQDWGVPDTLDGRFEMISLHMFVVLHRLKDEKHYEAFSQQLFDLFFADMDQCLREMGVGDTGIGVRIKHMAQSFYGRLKTYEAALVSESEMRDALTRNVYGTEPKVPLDKVKKIKEYLTKAMKCAEKNAMDEVIKGQLEIEYIYAT